MAIHPSLPGAVFGVAVLMHGSYFYFARPPLYLTADLRRAQAFYKPVALRMASRVGGAVVNIQTASGK